MTAQMEKYAKRLARAAPKRFEFSKLSAGWALYVIGSQDHYSIRNSSSPSQQWAFWGPLLDEHGIEEVSRECEYDNDPGVQGVTCLHSTMLEATADFVCCSFEFESEGGL